MKLENKSPQYIIRIFLQQFCKFLCFFFCLSFSLLHSCIESEKISISSGNLKEQYFKTRNEWLAKNSEINFSNQIVLNENEQKLNRHIEKLIIDFQNKYWATDYFCPTRNFLYVKSCLERSPLFLLLQKMPKGGLLHIHTTATGDAEWLIRHAAAYNNCYIYTGDSELKGTMGFFSKDKVPEGFQSMKKLAAEDARFIQIVVDMVVMTAQDVASANPWNKLNACFKRLSGLLRYEPLFREYYKTAFETLIKDKIQFVELRAGLHELFDDNQKIYSKNEVIDIYRTISQEIKERHPEFNLKIIISDLRSDDATRQKSLLEEAFQLRARNPDIVTGYDLVGYESTGHTTLYFLDNLLIEAHHLVQKYQTSLPYFFHDGESNWYRDINLFDTVLLGSKRIGHGFNLYYFPYLEKIVKERNICIEVCPISNQELGYVSDLRLHPAAGYLRRGIPCVLASDDPLILRTSGLSYDFWEAIMAWNLDLADIKQLCLNSILYSSLDESEKQQALHIWKEDWQQFVQAQISPDSPR